MTMEAQLVLKVDNTAARRLFLHKHALLEAPTGTSKGEDLLNLIHRIGFVQIDSINTVERAHHMILWSRRQSYRPKHLKKSCWRATEPSLSIGPRRLHHSNRILPLLALPLSKERREPAIPLESLARGRVSGKA